MELPRIPQTLIVGRADGMEAAVGTAAALSQQVTSVDSLAELDRLTPHTPPDLIVVCQHWSDQFSAGDVRRLIATFPLARIVCCYGEWCASDGRTRAAWPAAVRVPSSEAAARIRREHEVILGRRPPLPLTAGLDEVFEFDNT